MFNKKTERRLDKIEKVLKDSGVVRGCGCCVLVSSIDLLERLKLIEKHLGIKIKIVPEYKKIVKQK